MKKICFMLCIILILFFSVGAVYANNVQTSTENNLQTSVLSQEQTNGLIEMKRKSEKEISDYNELYGNETYGMTAYILNKIRIYSIPFCFMGIAVGAIFQYVLGIRRLDVRDRGFLVIIAFVTIAVICQVLPLIFAIVVKGWRN